MGTVALAGAALITLGSVLWYLLYVRRRVDREGVATAAVRQRLTESALADTAAASAAAGATDETADEPAADVLVALPERTDETTERALVGLAADVVRPTGRRVLAVRFEEVPDQTPLAGSTAQSPADRSFEARMAQLGAELGVEVVADEVVSHDTKHAIVNAAAGRGVGAILAAHEPLRLRSRLVGDPVDWVVRHAPCDVLLVDRATELDAHPERVAVAGDGGPYAPLAVSIAERVAAANDGSLSLWYPEDDTGERTLAVADYRADLAATLSVPVHTEPVRTDGGRPGRPDLLVRPGPGPRLRDALVGPPALPTPDCPAVTVYPHASRRGPLARRLLERLVF
jgi:nucleotide-binding universal stress UspA family protein